MQRFVPPFLAICSMMLLIGTASSYGLAPSTKTFSRRHALDRLVGFGSVSLVGLIAPPALAVEKAEDNPETTKDKNARELKEKIAASKKNYRKGSDYAKERFTTVDYSCVADTGSPCKEPKSVFPSDEKIASDGKIEDL
jgi:hypothetical protein